MKDERRYNIQQNMVNYLKESLFKFLLFMQNSTVNKFLNLYICSLFKGREHVADLLIKNGAKISASDKLGRTALHWAAKFGKFSEINF